MSPSSHPYKAEIKACWPNPQLRATLTCSHISLRCMNELSSLFSWIFSILTNSDDLYGSRLLIVSSLCLVLSPREQFLKSNAQLTFRCRQLLSELSYIYPIDVVSRTRWYTAAQHVFDRQLQRIIQGFDKAEMLQIVVCNSSLCFRMLFPLRCF